jgi:hypothetical protein
MEDCEIIECDSLLPKLEDRNVMTIVMISYFEGKILNIESVFYILPAVRTNQPKPKRKVNKIKFVHPGENGVIISAKYKNKVRGIIRAITEDSWEHSVVVDMSEEVKNINFKVSPTNLHMCGCKSIDMGINASKTMIDHINQAQMGTNLLQDHAEISDKIIEEILGECSYVDDKLDWAFDLDKIQIHENDNEIEGGIRGFLATIFSDTQTRSQAVTKYRWIKNIKPFISQKLEYTHFKMGMLKYRFNLNFKCKLESVIPYFIQIDNRFLGNYYSGVRNKVVFEFECFTKPEKKHTFSIERSGQVTHSCSMLEEIDYVFNLFISVIREIREYIIED